MKDPNYRNGVRESRRLHGPPSWGRHRSTNHGDILSFDPHEFKLAFESAFEAIEDPHNGSDASLHWFCIGEGIYYCNPPACHLAGAMKRLYPGDVRKAYSCGCRIAAMADMSEILEDRCGAVRADAVLKGACEAAATLPLNTAGGFDHEDFLSVVDKVVARKKDEHQP